MIGWHALFCRKGIPTSEKAPATLRKCILPKIPWRRGRKLKIGISGRPCQSGSTRSEKRHLPFYEQKTGMTERGHNAACDNTNRHSRNAMKPLFACAVSRMHEDEDQRFCQNFSTEVSLSSVFWKNRGNT